MAAVAAAASLKFCSSKDVLPFPAMVVMECANVGLNTLFKAATDRGLISYHIFIVYAYAVAALALSPSPFLSYRLRRGLPPLNFSIMSKIGLLGVIGCLSQNLGYRGINYSSPALASALSNLVPAFTFILAVTFRMEKLVFRSSSSQAKLLGTLISISGAIVVTFYKGPTILPAPTDTISIHQMPLKASSSNWVLGSLFLCGEYITYPIWYIVQAQIMLEYPDELTVIFYYNFCVAVLAAIVALFTESSWDAWKIGLNIALLSVVCSGIFGSFLNNVVHTWVIRLKGPFFVSMFKPLSIAIAVVMGVIFLGDGLYLGSIIGATVISVGFYIVMWGKAQEQKSEEHMASSSKSIKDQSAPLLQDGKTDRV